MAIAAALGYGLAVPALTVDDTATYLDPARSWAAGKGLLEADGRPLEYRLPAYPLVLGVAIRFLGDSPRVFSVLNVAFHVLGVLVVRRALRGTEPRSVDGLAALAIVYPPLLTSAGMVLQESLLSLLVALVLLAWWRALESPSLARSLVAGGAIGLACLGKVTALPLVAPLAILVSLAGRRSIARGAAVLLGTTLVLAPWGIRNLLVLGRLEVTNNNSGATFFGGTVSNSIENWSTLPEYRAALARWHREDRRLHPVLDRYLQRQALRRIAENPGHWLALVAERALRFMLPARHWFFQMGLSKPATLSLWYLVAIVFQALLFSAAAWLAVLAWRRRAPLTLWIIPTIVFTHQAVYALVYASPRYNVTIGPVLFGGLAIAVAELRTRRAGQGTRAVTSR